MNYLIIENNNPENISKIQQLNQHIRNKNPAVIYFYKDGCPFCERTTPEWDNLPNHLSKENDLLVARINKLLFDKFNSIGEKPALYPNIRYINGSNIDTFKKEGDERNTKNLAMWIQQHHKSTQPKISVSIQQPVQPIIQEPIIQKPIIQEPIIQEPIIQEPIQLPIQEPIQESIQEIIQEPTQELIQKPMRSIQQTFYNFLKKPKYNTHKKRKHHYKKTKKRKHHYKKSKKRKHHYKKSNRKGKNNKFYM